MPGQGTPQKDDYNTITTENGNGGGLCVSAHSATRNSKSAVTTLCNDNW